MTIPILARVMLMLLINQWKINLIKTLWRLQIGIKDLIIQLEQNIVELIKLQSVTEKRKQKQLAVEYHDHPKMTDYFQGADQYLQGFETEVVDLVDDASGNDGLWPLAGLLKSFRYIDAYRIRQGQFLSPLQIEYSVKK